MTGSKKHFGNYQERIGTRAQVYHGTAFKTSGGLKKSDLIKNKNGRIVSKAKHFTAKREKRLVKHGFGTKKGVFGFVRLGSKGKSSKGKSTKRKGGSCSMKRGGSGLSPLEPMPLHDKHHHNHSHHHRNIMHHRGGSQHTKHVMHKGGASPLSPMEISGIQGTSGADIQLLATNY